MLLRFFFSPDRFLLVCALICFEHLVQRVLNTSCLGVCAQALPRSCSRMIQPKLTQLLWPSRGRIMAEGLLSDADFLGSMCHHLIPLMFSFLRLYI